MSYLDPLPHRPDLLTSREVAKLLGGLFAGLSMTYGREVVRSAVLAMGRGETPAAAGHDLMICARLIAALLGGMSEMASVASIKDALSFWASVEPGAQAIEALPDKVEKDHGSRRSN